MFAVATVRMGGLSALFCGLKLRFGALSVSDPMFAVATVR